MPLASVGEEGKMTRSRDALLGGIADLVVGLGQREHPLHDRLVLVVPRPALVHGAADGALELFERELVVERAQDLAGKRAVDPQLEQLAEKQGSCRKACWAPVRAPSQTASARPCGCGCSASIVPLRNVIDEIWPSPVARRLSKNRRDPSVQARLVGVPDHRRD